MLYSEDMGKVNVIAKKMLAKVLAKENITVIHAGVRTAAFNVHKRILTLPIWHDISEDVYDLFIGHEISHALHTPDGEWTAGIIALDPKHPKAAKSCFNIVEDARIERLIKTLYPGLKAPFYRAYKELIERGFFGNVSRINKLGILDRINVHFKAGIDIPIEFTPRELEFVDRVDRTMTFTDVAEVCKDLYEYAKNEEKIKEEDAQEEDSDVETESRSSYGEENEDSEVIDPDQESPDPTDDEEEEEEKDPEDLSGKKELAEEEESDEPPQSSTDTAWEENKGSLAQSSPPIQYVTVPMPKLENIIVPYREVHDHIRKFYEKMDQVLLDKWIPLHTIEYERFMQESKPVVGWLLQEFQRHRAADQSVRTKTHVTGDLDLTRLHEFRTGDNIFLESEIVPGATNHTLRMFVDWSTSVQSEVLGIVHQLLNLVLFARKAQIDFEVYTFGARAKIHAGWTPGLGKLANNHTFTHSYGDYGFYDGFTLRTIFSSKMNANEFKQAGINMLLMASGATTTTVQISKGYMAISMLPEDDQMGGTPLNEAYVVSMEMAKQLKKRFQIVNFIYLTDGEPTTRGYYCADPKTGTMMKYERGQQPVVIQDTQTHMDYVLEDDEQKIFLSMLRERGVKTVCYYISSSAPSSCALMRFDPRIKTLEGVAAIDKEFEDNYFVSTKAAGYDECYILPAGSKLRINTATNMFTRAATNRQLVTMMSESGVQQRKMRVMLTRFIKLIA